MQQPHLFTVHYDGQSTRGSATGATITEAIRKVRDTVAATDPHWKDSIRCYKWMTEDKYLKRIFPQEDLF